MLTQPCSNCPFLRGSPFERSMSHPRAQEIADSLRMNGFFPCHKTTTAGGALPGGELWCAGALLTLAAGDEAYDNQAVRVGLRLGLCPDPYWSEMTKQLDKVYENLDQWLDSHD